VINISIFSNSGSPFPLSYCLWSLIFFLGLSHGSSAELGGKLSSPIFWLGISSLAF
jgi:hypothetical protein